MILVRTIIMVAIEIFVSIISSDFAKQTRDPKFEPNNLNPYPNRHPK